MFIPWSSTKNKQSHGNRFEFETINQKWQGFVVVVLIEKKENKSKWSKCM